MERSWAKVFAEEIFPTIDEGRFAVLYSDKASRPNTPVTIIIGALILKELLDFSDDEVVESLMLDFRFRYALHTTSFEEQPLSDKSLTGFRQRCYDYEETTGIALYHGCVTELAGKTKTHCHPKIYKKVCKVKASKKMRERARMQAKMKTEEFKNYAKLRNGAETIPSLLKNVYGVNKMRVHGKLRCKFFFGSKIAALNFRSFSGFERARGIMLQIRCLPDSRQGISPVKSPV